MASPLDPTFGTGGLVRTPFRGSAGVNALILQPDGKLVATGRANGDFALVRDHTDGSVDASFGIRGLVRTDFGESTKASALILQPDGELVAAGGANGDFTLARDRGCE